MLPSDIQIRPLTLEEFPLASGPENVIWPSNAVILGAWRGEKLVGRIGLVVLPHIEGLWVDPAERGVGDIARALHSEIENASRELGREFIFAFVPENLPGMAGHLSRAEYEKLPIELYGKKL